MPIVQLPDGRTASFPDGVSVSDMESAISANFPEFTPAKEEKYNLLGGVADVGKLIYDIPTQAKAAIANLTEEDDPLKTHDWRDQWREEGLARTRERLSALGDAGGENVFPGITRKDIAEASGSTGFSLASMGAGLLGGAAGFATPVPGGAAVGMLSASGVAAYKMDKSMFTAQLLDAANAALMRERGSVMDDAERAAFLEKTSEARENHALWEAGPEAVGNLLTATGAGAVFKGVSKGIASKIVGGLAKMYGGELSTETVTQMGQQRAEVDTGMSQEPAREWSSGEDWAKSLKEVYPGTMVLSTLTGGGAAIAGKATDLITRKEKPVENILQDIGVGNPNVDIDEAISATNARVDEVGGASVRSGQIDESMPSTPLSEYGAPGLVTTPSQQPGVAMESIAQGLSDETQRTQTAVATGIPVQGQQISQQPATIEQSTTVPDIAKTELLNGPPATSEPTGMVAGEPVVTTRRADTGVSGLERGGAGSPVAATGQSEPVLGGGGEVAVSPTVSTSKDGRVRVTGITKEQAAQIRGSLKIKGVVIGNNGSAIFPKSVKKSVIMAALGIEDAKIIKPRNPQKASSDLLQRIKQLGGIDADQALDITGEKRGVGGWRFAFKNGGRGLDDLAISLAGEGFNIDTSDTDGGVQQLRDMIRSHIGGERNFRNVDIEQQVKSDKVNRDKNDLIEYAKSLGIKWQNLTDAQIEDAIYFIEDDARMAAIAESEDISDEEAGDAQEIAGLAEDGADIQFGDDVETDNAALAAFLGEENGQTSGRDIVETPTGAAQEATERRTKTGEPAQAGAYALEGQTEAEIREAEEAQLRADVEAQRTQQAEEREANKREQESRRKRNVNTVASDNFQLGQSREEVTRMADTGMTDMFGQQTKSGITTSAPKADESATAKFSRASQANDGRQYNPALSEIYVTLKLIDEDGNPVKWSGKEEKNPGRMKADAALKESDSRIEKLKQLLECLG